MEDALGCLCWTPDTSPGGNRPPIILVPYPQALCKSEPYMAEDASNATRGTCFGRWIKCYTNAVL